MTAASTTLAFACGAGVAHIRCSTVLDGDFPLDADGGVIATAHAGWRDALHGVLPATVAAMQAHRVRAVLGPCIGPCCYEFGTDPLATFVERFGADVASTTTWSTPSLSMPEVVRRALALCDVPLQRLGACTRCDPRWFSHRRGDAGRHVMTATLARAV